MPVEAVRHQDERGAAAVIGAGIVGVATALYLQRDGWRVTIVDPEEPGEGTSKGNAGIIAQEHIIPLGTLKTLLQVPAMLIDSAAPLSLRWRHLPTLAPWLLRLTLASRPSRVEAISRALAGLLGGVLDAYRPLLESAGARDLVRYKGLHQIYQTERAFRRDAAALEIKRRMGIKFEILSGGQARERLPALGPSVRHGVWYPDCAHTLDPHRLVQILALDFARKGGRFERRKADGFAWEDGRVTAVRAGGNTLAADLTVVSAGAWSRPLARMLGQDVPLESERGYHVTLPGSGVELETPILSADHGFAITSMTPGLRIAGTVELANLEAPPDPKRNRILESRAKTLFPGLKIGGGSDWMGHRPSLPDSMPVIGPVPGCSNAYLAFGHGHLGLTGAAVTGRAIADMAAGRQTGFDIAPFSPARFS